MADLDTKEGMKRGVEASKLPPHPSLRRSNYHSRPGLLTLPLLTAFPPDQENQIIPDYGSGIPGKKLITGITVAGQ